MSDSDVCRDLPNLLSTFIDTFVDYTVSGLFLPPPPPSSPPPNPNNRLIAIGDLHGDLSKTKQSLNLANLIDSTDNWIAKDTTLIQIGDVLDRGGDELKILYFLEKLKRQAAQLNSKVITMNGNHEIMNVDADFRYVTPAGLNEFLNWSIWFRVGNDMKCLCAGLQKPNDVFEGIPYSFRNVNDEFVDGIRARIAAFRPNGPIASRFLSRNVTVLVVHDSVFVHGGLLAQHVNYGLERINEEVKDWINGLKGRRSPGYLRGKNSVVWLRKFSETQEKNCDCELLEHVLETIPGAKRMIMGHTIQEIGINGVCENRAIRIDVGMSKGCINGLPEVLEIDKNIGLRVLTSNKLYQKSEKSFSNARHKDGAGFLVMKHGPKPVEVQS